MLYLNMKMRSALLKVATLIICATSLNISAIAQDNDREVFYRVSNEQYAILSQNLPNIDPSFVIVAKSLNRALQNSTLQAPKTAKFLPTYPSTSSEENECVNLSDDLQELYLDPTNAEEMGLKLRFYNSSASKFAIFSSNGDNIYANAPASGSIATIQKEETSNSKSFYQCIPAGDDGYTFNVMAYPINYTPKSDPYYLTYRDAGTGSKFRIEQTETEHKDISIYFQDYFNLSLNETGNTAEIELMMDISTKIRVNPIYIHYILNNGDNVSIQDLIDSSNRELVAGPEMTAKSKTNISIDGNNNTIWALPVMDNPISRSNESLIPVGRIFKGVFAEDSGVSTGIVSAVAEAENAEAEYYTIQGQRASQPLAPGLYIKRLGSKATKTFVK